MHQEAVPLVNVTWTLCYELLFYMFFSLAIINKYIGLIIFASWQTSIAVVAIFQTESGHDIFFLNPICLEFGAGVVFAIIAKTANFQKMKTPLSVCIFVSGLILISLDFIAVDPWFPVFCVLGTGLVIVSSSVLEERFIIAPPRFLTLIGDASFSIYLVHFSLIRLVSSAAKHFGFQITGFYSLGYVVLGIIGGVSFDRIIDRPIQRRGKSLKQRLGIL